MKDGPSESKENKENREKKGDREGSKARAATNRRGKGASRSRQGTLTDLFFSDLECLTTSEHNSCFLLCVLFAVCPHPARPEENGVEVTPVDRGSDRGRRQRGGRGEWTVFETLSVRGALQWMLLTFFW